MLNLIKIYNNILFEISNYK